MNQDLNRRRYRNRLNDFADVYIFLVIISPVQQIEQIQSPSIFTCQTLQNELLPQLEQFSNRQHVRRTSTQQPTKINHIEIVQQALCQQQKNQQNHHIQGQIQAIQPPISQRASRKHQFGHKIKRHHLRRCKIQTKNDFNHSSLNVLSSYTFNEIIRLYKEKNTLLQKNISQMREQKKLLKSANLIQKIQYESKLSRLEKDVNLLKKQNRYLTQQYYENKLTKAQTKHNLTKFKLELQKKKIITNHPQDYQSIFHPAQNSSESSKKTYRTLYQNIRNYSSENAKQSRQQSLEPSNPSKILSKDHISKSEDLSCSLYHRKPPEMIDILKQN